MFLKSFSLLASALFLATLAHGWSDTGHMVIAAIAERDLTPSARTEIARLLGIDAKLGMPFWQGAVWADETRTQANGPWHYIDIHFRTDGKRTTNQPDAENVVWALNRFEPILADKTKPDAERKEALLYILHFVGDSHQPLHAVSRDSDAQPSGDKGGNAFAIKPPVEFSWMQRPPKNLHSLWDMGCGLFVFENRPYNETLERRIRAQADTLRAALPMRNFRRARDLEPMDWAKEGLDASKKVVYQLDEYSEPNEDYLAKGRMLAAQRATLAGYRLGEVLNRILQ